MTPHIRTAVHASTTLATFCAALFTWLLYFGTEAAFPHEAIPTAAAPLGWAYGFECCSSLDCRQIAPSAVSEAPQGYTIKQTGEVIPYGDKRLKQSRDEFYHQCTIGGNPDAPHSICLYTPDRGF